MAIEALVGEALIAAVGLGILIKQRKVSAVEPQPVTIPIPVKRPSKY